MRKPGESKEAYRARLRALASGPDRLIRGHVATAQGPKPWTRAQSTGLREEDWRKLPLAVQEEFRRARDIAEAEEQAEIQALRSSVPAAKKRTGQERLRSLTDRLLQDAERNYRATGQLLLPRSVLEAISKELAAQGMFHDPRRIEEMTLEQFTPLLRVWAKRMLEEAQRKSGSDLTPVIRAS